MAFDFTDGPINAKVIKQENSVSIILIWNKIVKFYLAIGGFFIALYVISIVSQLQAFVVFDLDWRFFIHRFFPEDFVFFPIALISLYLIAGVILNKTTIFLDNSALILKKGPIAFYKPISIPLVNISTLIVSVKYLEIDYAPIKKHSLTVQLKSGSQMVLLWFLMRDELQHFLNKEITDWLEGQSQGRKSQQKTITALPLENGQEDTEQD